jgi:IS30 family transposase
MKIRGRPAHIAIEALGPLPASLRRTLTWDRGAEMAKHADITAALGTQVYFCDRACPLATRF